MKFSHIVKKVYECKYYIYNIKIDNATVYG